MVRLDDIDDMFSPRLQDAKDAQTMVQTIMVSSQQAIIHSSAGEDLKVGDRVEGYFEIPPSQNGEQRNFIIDTFLSNQGSGAFRENIIKILSESGFGELASAFESGPSPLGSQYDGVTDIIGNINGSGATQALIDDVVRLIKESNNTHLLPLNIGSRKRTFEGQMKTLVSNVTGWQGGDPQQPPGWFNTTYGPKIANPLPSPPAAGSEVNYTDRKIVKKHVSAILKSIINNASLTDEEKQLQGGLYMKTYSETYTGLYKYGHMNDSAIDFKTWNNQEHYDDKLAPRRYYSNADKDLLVSIIGQSAYSVFVNLESRDSVGEHIHASARPDTDV